MRDAVCSGTGVYCVGGHNILTYLALLTLHILPYYLSYLVARLEVELAGGVALPEPSNFVPVTGQGHIVCEKVSS